MQGKKKNPIQNHVIVQKKESGGRRFLEVNPGVGGDAEHPDAQLSVSLGS